jgi:hypothetical protein
MPGNKPLKPQQGYNALFTTSLCKTNEPQVEGKEESTEPNEPGHWQRIKRSVATEAQVGMCTQQ